MSSNPKILVTGGAGYVGSHTCKALARVGFEPVAYDNLSCGHAALAQWGPLETGDIRDRERLNEVFRTYRPIAVIHLAARTEVALSFEDPGEFYDVNVAGSLALIAAAREAGMRHFIFSSSCAVYGPCQSVPMTEDHPTCPISPYGHSKLMIEQILRDMSRAGSMHHLILRYFNVAGADPGGEAGERHEPETHVVPLLIQKVLNRRSGFNIYGTDYETRDGTAERDYVHVSDLAEGNCLALRYLLDGGASDTLNLGAGRGSTVREIVDGAARLMKEPVPVLKAERRPGDPAQLIADISKAERLLAYKPLRGDLDTILGTALHWHRDREPVLFPHEGPSPHAQTASSR